MEKIWLKNYPAGVPHEIDVYLYASLVDYFEQSCKAFPDRIAFVNDPLGGHPSFLDMSGEITFKALWDLSDRLAAYLQHDLQVKKGDRVMIMMPNLLQYPLAILAILKVGAVVVNVNPLYTEREFEYVLEDAKPSVIIVLANVAHTVSAVLAKKNHSVSVIVTELGDQLPFPKNKITYGAIHYLKHLVPSYHFSKRHDWQTIIAHESHAALEGVNVSLDDMAFLQYTGGTTGVSKGAVLTHKNMVSNVLQVRAWVQPYMNSEEVVITALPLYHIFALMANCLLFLNFGAKNVLITNPKDLDGFIHMLARHPFTVMIAVNTLFDKLANHPKFSDLDFTHLKFSLGGGMAVTKEVAEHWLSITNCPLLQGYGLSETSPVLTVGRLDSKTFTPSIGFPMPSTEVAFFDEAGHELPLGETGELGVRGPQVMSGYWGERMQEETRKVFTKDGFFLTGDIGYMNPEGSLVMTDRKKDMIIISGLKVFPSEVEGVIMGLPGVHQVAVVRSEDEAHHELVKAFVVRDDPAVTFDGIIEICRKNLAHYKVPTRVEFRESLPLSPLGKVLRRELH